MILIKYKYTIVFALGIFIYSTFMISLFFQSIPDNPIKIKKTLDYPIFNLLPQGWSFFTRNSREAQITCYRILPNHTIEELPQRHSSIYNFFGIKRRATKILSELQVINSNLTDDMYTNVTWNYQRKLFSDIPEKFVIVENKMDSPILSGDIVVVYQRTIPWAWVKSIEKIKMPAKIIRIKISVPDKI